MIIKITEVAQEFTKNGAGYRKVKGTSDGREVTKSVFDNLNSKWSLLEEGAELEFKMEKKGQFWNVVDILPINDMVQEAVKLGGVVESATTKDLKDLGIKRQSSIKASVDIVGSMVKAGLIKEHIQTKVLDWAEIFFTYYNQDK